MKIICIEDLNGFRLNKNGNFSRNGHTYYIGECIKCNDWFYSTNKTQKHCSGSCSKMGKLNPMFGMFGKLNSMHKMTGSKNPAWKGGYNKKIPLYDTYAKQLIWCEQVRRNKEDKNILEVKCAYCGKWFKPKRYQVSNRIDYLNGNKIWENRFYCSTSCKQECPIYKKSKWPEGFKIATSREVQPELRQMVLKRDNYTCQKCGSKKSLHCHHLEGIRWEPIESADVDKCITLCKECHKLAHKIPGCGYNDMRCK